MSDIPPPPNDESRSRPSASSSSSPSSSPASAPPPPPPPPPPTGLTAPPGYVAYQGQPTPSAPIRRVGGLATPIIVATVIVALGTLVSAFLSAGAATDAADFLAGSISQDEFEDSLVSLNAVQLMVSVATLAAGVLTIVWMFRIAKNVRAFGRATTWSPLFAIFGWFLPPLVLYVIPFLVLRELWKASEPTQVDGTDSWKRSPDNPVLWAWFVLFGILPAVIFAVQIGSFAASGLPAGDIESVADGLDDFGALEWLTAVLSVAAAVVWVRFVRQLTQRHMRLTSER